MFILKDKLNPHSAGEFNDTKDMLDVIDSIWGHNPTEIKRIGRIVGDMTFGDTFSNARFDISCVDNSLIVKNIWLDIEPAPEGYYHCNTVNKAKNAISYMVSIGYPIETIAVGDEFGSARKADGGSIIDFIKWCDEKDITVSRSCYSDNHTEKVFEVAISVKEDAVVSEKDTVLIRTKKNLRKMTGPQIICSFKPIRDKTKYYKGGFVSFVKEIEISDMEYYEADEIIDCEVDATEEASNEGSPRFTDFDTLNRAYGIGCDRHDLTEEEERRFVADCFDTYEHFGFSETFQTPYEEYEEYNGKKFVVLGRLKERTPENLTDQDSADLACLPMWSIQFEDGKVAHAYAEEICLAERNDSEG